MYRSLKEIVILLLIKVCYISRNYSKYIFVTADDGSFITLDMEGQVSVLHCGIQYSTRCALLYCAFGSCSRSSGYFMNLKVLHTVQTKVKVCSSEHRRNLHLKKPALKGNVRKPNDWPAESTSMSSG